MPYAPRRLSQGDAAWAVDRGDLMPWRECAELLGVRSGTMARWIDRGQLPYVVIERRRWVDLAQAADLERILRQAGPARHGRGITSV